MKRQTVILVFVASALACSPQTKADEANESSLPTILLIGDSIAGGYQKEVTRALKDKAVVVKNEGNAEWTGTGLKKIDAYLGDTKWDIIHFTGSGNGALASRVTAVLEAALAERDNQ